MNPLGDNYKHYNKIMQLGPNNNQPKPELLERHEEITSNYERERERELENWVLQKVVREVDLFDEMTERGISTECERRNSGMEKYMLPLFVLVEPTVSGSSFFDFDVWTSTIYFTYFIFVFHTQSHPTYLILFLISIIFII